MAITNTSLTFETEGQSLWGPGAAINLYVDTGSTLIYDPDEVAKYFGIDLWIIEAGFTAYLDMKFGLLAWANLGRSGSWDASYEIDVFVNHPNAILGGDAMVFDFSNYDILAAEIESLGFGAGDDGIGAGLKLILGLEAGVRDIYVDWPWPAGDDNFGGFKLIDIDHEIDLIKVNLKLPELEIELTEGVKLTARLPQGADTEGESEHSGLVSGEGTSDTNFLELSADLDELLLKLLGKIPEPTTQAVVKFLGETVFAEHEYDLGDYVSFIPNGKIGLEFTFVDVELTAGLALTEQVDLDIRPLDIPGGLTEAERLNLADIDILLVSDNGTPDNPFDDISTSGKLGSVLTLPAPRTVFDSQGRDTGAVPSFGTATVSAEYSIARAKFEHEIGLALTFGIEINILKGALNGSWVPSFLEVEFGPLLKIEFPDEEDGGWEIGLGKLFDHGFEVDGSVFNTETADYEVFFVQPEIAPTDWNPNLPGAEEAIYGYFDAIFEQQEKTFEEFSDASFQNQPGSPPPVGVLDYRNASVYPTKIFFAWTGAFNTEVYVNETNGSVIMADIAVPATGGGLVKDNLRVMAGNRIGFAEWGQFDSPFAVLYDQAYYSGYTSSLTYEYFGKTLVSHGPTNVQGEDLGDVLALYKGGTYYDGGANLNGQHDVFVANFAAYYPNTAIEWDLAAALNAGTGVTLAGEVDVYNVEAMAIITGYADDFIVAAAKSDVIFTGAGNDIVKNRYYVIDNGVTITDTSDDYISLGVGDDTALMELGNFLGPYTTDFVDWVIGGQGDDHVFVRSGLQGLRYNVSLYFESGGFGTYSTIAGADGIASTASHGQLASLLDYALRGIEGEYLTGDYTGNLWEANTPEAWISIQNGADRQGEIRIARDVESISIIIDEGSPDQGQGDDLMLFMGGTRYDGGVSGLDTFVADFGAYEWRLGTRGGVQIDAGDPDGDSYFGQTIISRIDRLHVHGTSEADVIYGGAYEDRIWGESGDDFLSGGIDEAADIIEGGSGNDRFYWADNGNDTYFGGAGVDILTISADQVADDPTSGSTSPDYKFGGNHAYTFYDGAGDVIGYVDSSSDADDLIVILDALRDGLVASQTSWFGDSTLTYSEIEQINFRASFDGNDALIYQGGLVYDAGEAMLGNDRDLFAADFRGQSAGIDFEIGGRYETQTGKVLANGVFISGVDRAVILAGDGNDILTGGWLSDAFVGGGGNDILFGGEGNDTLRGGQGNDTFYYDGFGYDEIEGGTNAPGEPELDHLIIGGFSGYARVALLDAAGEDILTANRGIVRWDNSREDFHDLALKSLIADTVQYYSSTPGNPSAWYGRSLTHVTYREIEAVDIAGTGEFDDVILYQGGAGYVGGEREGDADIFVADLRGFSEDLTLDVTVPGGVGYDIGQGTQVAGFERMHVLLGSGSDIFVGGDLDDAAFGGAGQDELSGGLGNDWLVGEAGEDLFDHVGGHDTISGGSGNDVLALSDMTNPFTLRFLDAAGQAIGPAFDLAGGQPDRSAFASLFAMSGAVFTVQDHGASRVTYDGIEEITASAGAGADVLISGTTQGALFGGDGDDVLIGQGGNDFLSGGDGNDTYVMGAGFGEDIVFGETGGSNRILFTAYARADLDFVIDGNDLLVNAGTDSLRILGYFAQNATVGLNFVFDATDQVFTQVFSAPASLAASASGTAAPFLGDGITRVGTDGDDDFYEHSERSDVLRGFGGDDFFESSLGADLLDGGAGRDAVSYLRSGAGVQIDLTAFRGFGGEAEGDLLVSIEHADGSLFDDLMIGNAFRNNLFGNDGDDTIEGLGGDDHLTGDEGHDSVSGGDGHDLLYGGDGNDTISGGAGTDYLDGGKGNDLLDGGAQADILDDGMGDDTAYGGDGNDFFRYGAGVDTWFGEAGRDTADFDAFAHGIRANLAVPGGMVRSRLATDLDPSRGPLVDLVTLTGFENLRGSLGNDELLGDAGDNQIEGNLGADILVGGDGVDTLLGGAGIDTLDYSQEAGLLGVNVLMSIADQHAYDTFGNRDIVGQIEVVIGTDRDDYMAGGAEDNILYGRGGGDRLDGLDGDDWIDGGAGEDTLQSGNGDDTLVGGTGDDLVRAGWGDDFIVEGENTGNDTYYGDQDFDTVSYAAVAGGITVDLRLNDGQVTGPNVDADSLRNVENIIGGAGDDTMTGNDEANWFSYLSGFDRFDGRGGMDTAVFKYFDAAVEVDLAAPSVARTQDAPDLASGTWRQIASLTAIENVIGSVHGDNLNGNDGDNGLYGEAGNDTLAGGLGNDSLFGGAGNDRIIGFSGDGANLFAGGDGIDVLDYSDNAESVVASLLDGDGDDTVADVEWLIGTDHGDYLLGNDGDNTIQAGLGDYDLIEAGAGNDLMIYTGGEDYFYGGAGIDAVDFSLFGFAILADLRERNDTVLTAMTSSHVGATTLAAVIYDMDVENLIGTRFDDRLIGDDRANLFSDGEGDDIVQGGGGDDGFAYADGTDDWDGGAGRDTANFSSFRFAADIDLDTGVMRSSNATDLAGGALTARVTMTAIEYAIGSSFGDALRGDAADNALSGWAGDDTLDGRDGNDTLFGGAGNDLLLAGAGADSLNGGDGVDTLSYADSDAAVTVDLRAGSGGGGHAEGDRVEGIEHLIGSAHADMLTGDGGANTLVGGAGDDTVAGGGGNDVFLHGGGEDSWQGGDGQDLADFATHGAAIEADLLAGQIRTQDAPDLSGSVWRMLAHVTHLENVTGTAFADSLIGDALANHLAAGAGNDRLSGGSANDTLDGGAGDDTLIGGRGDDDLRGGAGRDLVSYEDAMTGVFASLRAPGVNVGDAEGDTYVDIEDIAGSALDDTLTGDNGVNMILGGDGHDRLDGAGHDDVLDGGDGNDTIIGGKGRDRAFMGGGADLFQDNGQGGNSGRDTVYGGDGNDTVQGGNGDDVFHGDAGNDKIFARLGNDAVFGGDGDDTIDGGDGADTVVGGNGRDKVFLGGGNDVFTDNQEGGLEGRDTVSGGGGADTIQGGNGDDSFFGGAGNDSILGRLGNDTLSGNLGDDVLIGGDGDDVISGAGGNDDLKGDSGNDQLFGGTGADTLSAGTGNDTVTGGDGRDLTYLGDGDDLFIDNAQDGVNGQDTVFGNAGNDIVGGGAGNDEFHGQDGNDRLLGRLGDDKLYGGNQNDTMDGGDGNDTIAGGNGRDRAIMGGGNDVWFDNAQAKFGEDFVSGGAGNDTINMAGGNDTAEGGSGADVFIFGRNIDADTITDYQVGVDTLQINARLWGGALTQGRLDALSSTVSGALVLDFGDGDSITFANLSSNAGLLSDIVLG
ncbi:hypothetical protein [Thetidibacter halocola]|uniref:Uncharacterized protein n=1 Tax=Thetidibacter halocola TaxID=2827239 RepID=A0A8J7WK49_9RHOB|nr:hypothetical protein [Thetidibacter halocola]MBS0126803.1 hypothetical protein [Thetidibacter halocola]